VTTGDQRDVCTEQSSAISTPTTFAQRASLLESIIARR
jgi:hypothetical protein